MSMNNFNMKSLTQALAKTAAVIEKKVQTTVQEVTGPKPLQDYELINQIGSAGPGLVWKLYSARAVRESARLHQYPTVCVWVLDKRALSESRTRMGLSKSAEDAFLDLIRADANRLVRLRHPGVVHIVQALDENKNAMAMVTEPLFASVANALGNLENIGTVPKELKGMEMGLLEMKHGLLQIAESLDFLHNHAHLVHRAISPENVLITSGGAWKLAGFGFAISADQTSDDSANMQAFHYAEYDVEDSVLPLQPSLNYTAPELVHNKASASFYSDVFSFACVAYHLIAHKPLFDCHNNAKMYMNTLSYLSSEAFSSIPLELAPELQRMLSANESSRPTAIDFTGSPFFRHDMRLRALRFLDHILERDNIQKSEFIKALSDMWKDFDSRVLRYKVLPPLCAELRNAVLQPMILPMVLTIAESQDKNDFELSTLPALVPVLSNAGGDTLLLLVKHADLIIDKTSQEQLVSHVLPMFVRAYDDSDPRIQEQALKKSASIAKKIDTQLLKQAILPRVHGSALKTTVAAVRVNALLCFGELIPTLDKLAVLEILQTIQRCTAVDRSAPTLMCTLGVANAILDKYEVDFVAEHVLPLLTPLLTAQQLNVQQFAKYILFVREILRKIEEKRGVSVTDSVVSDVNSFVTNSWSQTQASSNVNSVVASTTKETTKSKNTWDEDWVSGAKRDSSPATSSVIKSGKSMSVNQEVPNPIRHPHSATSIVSNQQTAASCTPVDIEWPPRSYVTEQFGDVRNKSSLQGKSCPSDLGDIDPFADWPPRPSGSLASSGTYSNGSIGSTTKSGSTSTVSTSNGLNLQSVNDNSWSFDPKSLNIGNTPLNSGSLNGNSHNFQSATGFSSSSGSNAGRKSSDLGSIFASSKNDQTAFKLAPPPSNTVMRGRGRGRGSATSSASHSIHTKTKSEPTQFLDLLG